MKRYLSIFLFLYCTLLIQAQDLVVQSFRLDESDLTANTVGTIVMDQNGQKCALIKVETSETGFAFDTGTLGVSKTEQHVGEIWVYVPEGVKRITISHQQLGVLRDYDLGQTLKRAKTYIMRLTTGEVQTTIRQARTSQYVVFQLTPPNAVVELDGELLSTSGGTATKMMRFGTYGYRVNAPDYKPEVGKVTVNDPKNKHVVSVALKPNFSAVTLTVDGDVEIWVNGEHKGTGSWQGDLGVGTYEFETRKANHRSAIVTRDIQVSSEPQAIHLPAPTPILGEADINSSPAMADIYIDGQKVGQTPQLVEQLLIGQHQVRISKQGYQDYSATLNVKENEPAILSATLEKLKAEQAVVNIPSITSDESRKVITVGNVSFTMIRVDGGTFTMGATSEQGSDAQRHEKPAHQVTLSPYYMGETEVTQALWEAVMGNNPSYFKGAKRPVEEVSWDDCLEFIRKLNQKTGQNFRLPTEAEWEYAARGGNKGRGYKYSGSNQLDEVAWYKNTTNSKGTRDVKAKQANELGLYDMSGNVWEWCQDWYGVYSSSSQTNPIGPSSSSGSYRVDRGGSWCNDAWLCRVPNRSSFTPGCCSDDLGLRLALNAKENEPAILSATLENSKAEQTEQAVVNTPSTTSDESRKVITVGNVSFTMIRVDGGTFAMGATSEHGSDAYDSEEPAHQVTLSPYFIGETEVTQALWEAVMGSNPSKFKGTNKPIESVNWNDCQDFVRKLNKKTGLNFRLPTEAEWEYAARGGNKSRGFKYAGSNTIGDVAWYTDNSGSTTHDVKTKSCNELGLYDMSGNVWEWCQDWKGGYSRSAQTNPTGPSSGSYRVFRGGSWINYAGDCRVSNRSGDAPGNGSIDLGLRLALQ